MAYNFNNTTSAWVEFAIAPLVGSLDAFTIATLLKRPATGTDTIIGWADSTLATVRGNLRIAATGNAPNWFDNANLRAGTQNMSSTSAWYLLVCTRAAGASVTSRFHVHDGSSWVHANSAGVSVPVSLGGTDRVRVGIDRTTTNPMNGDIVCVGVKTSDSADATVETLSRTAWTAWTGFGFTWLAGFETIAAVQDQGTAGTGDESSRGAGVTLVSDPPGWAWAGAPPSTFVPQVVIVNA